MNGNQSKFLKNLKQIIGRSRYVVLVAVIAVMLVSLSLFLLGQSAQHNQFIFRGLNFYQGEADSIRANRRIALD